jgi:CubicO group peptidase (beta-lactamase class C family)
MTPLEATVARAMQGTSPVASAAVALVAVDGRSAASIAVGVTSRWDGGTEQAGDEGAHAVTATTIFDLASITKLFTAAALLIALDARGHEADALVADVLPEFRSAALRQSTFADLLRHTGGWPAEWPDRRRDVDALRRFRAGSLRDAPGVTYRYSCVGYIWAGLAAEALTGSRLDTLIQSTLLGPLGMSDTGFAPPAELNPRIAATEYQTDPPRGRVHGVVHDETAWALGGVTGNAGMFGTAPDLIRFAEVLRCAGMFGQRRILPEWIAHAMTTNQLPDPVGARPQYGQALGARIADRGWMGVLAERGGVGHTGFTGTSMLAVPGGHHSVVFLTNRVHPSRHGPGLHALRGRVADEAARL